ncbi:MAG: hypothetical protein AAF458_11570 [Pseudomonadota bacterium]
MLMRSDDGPALHRAHGSRLPRALRLKWLGQTVASLCWIGSVLSYGVSATGDWLQLFAALAWLSANLAALATADGD